MTKKFIGKRIRRNEDPRLLTGQALFVDDFPANVEGARAVGMEAILYTPDSDLEPALERWLSNG